MTSPTFVQVHLGPDLPDYLWQSLRQIRVFNPAARMHLVVNRRVRGLDPGRAFELGVVLSFFEDLWVSPLHRRFRRKSRLDRHFHDGFLFFAAERFFVLESLMRQQGLQDVIHLENDVLIYEDMSKLLPAFRKLYGRLASTFDHDRRCIPGFSYVRDVAALSRLTTFLATDKRVRKVFDMQAIAMFRNSLGEESCGMLPVVPTGYADRHPMTNLRGERPADPRAFSAGASALEGIFDAAAIGQFIGGIDPRNSGGVRSRFVNETACYDPRDLPVSWSRDGEGRWRPFVSCDGSLVRLHTLHVHSKDLGRFASWQDSEPVPLPEDGTTGAA